ncbi:hypothetical protein P154DRAFT_411522, partial [Amniculicola lignicola CBS 123094]
TTTPTSAPTFSKKPDRKLKLRASCDSCAASKVKCSKEHPICQRCSASGSNCIYGVSRKHGKPGRTRKRNPDGTPFIKASKQRPSPDGSEFGKFRVRAETILPNAYLTPEPEQIDYSSTPEWPATPEFDYSMTPESMSLYSDPDYVFMDDLIMGGSQSSMDSYRSQSMDSYVSNESVESEPSFTNPFTKKEPVVGLGLSLPQDYRMLKDYVGGAIVQPMAYTNPTPSYYPPQLQSPAQSPKGSLSPLQNPIPLPQTHSCSTLAQTTLSSLSLPQTSGETKTLEVILSTAKTATDNLLQLLSCPCSSEPHHAMLYSSIAAKILTWYQIAAGLHPTSATPSHTSPPLASTQSRSSSHSSHSSLSSVSSFSSTSTSSSSYNPSNTLQPPAIQISGYEYEPVDQDALLRQIVLSELEKCNGLVETLASWRGKGTRDGEQAEFLYDAMGTWLKGEVWRTVKDIEGAGV